MCTGMMAVFFQTRLRVFTPSRATASMRKYAVSRFMSSTVASGSEFGLTSARREARSRD